VATLKLILRASPSAVCTQPWSLYGRTIPPFAPRGHVAEISVAADRNLTLLARVVTIAAETTRMLRGVLLLVVQLHMVLNKPLLVMQLQRMTFMVTM